MSINKYKQRRVFRDNKRKVKILRRPEEKSRKIRES